MPFVLRGLAGPAACDPSPVHPPQGAEQVPPWGGSARPPAPAAPPRPRAAAPPRPAPPFAGSVPESGRRALSPARTFSLWCGSRGRPLSGGSEQQAILETSGLGRLLAVGERMMR